MGVLIRRFIVFGGLHWGPFILGNYHIGIGLTCKGIAWTDPIHSGGGIWHPGEVLPV